MSETAARQRCRLLNADWRKAKHTAHALSAPSIRCKSIRSASALSRWAVVTLSEVINCSTSGGPIVCIAIACSVAIARPNLSRGSRPGTRCFPREGWLQGWLAQVGRRRSNEVVFGRGALGASSFTARSATLLLDAAPLTCPPATPHARKPSTPPASRSSTTSRMPGG